MFAVERDLLAVRNARLESILAGIRRACMNWSMKLM